MHALVRRQLPNSLTILRAVLAASFFAALGIYRYPEQHVWLANVAIALFVLAAITDALDGYFARKWEVTSTFGRIMDPFCDKVLILGALVYLAGPRFVMPSDDGSTVSATAIYPWMVVVILARELLVTAIRGVVESMNISFPSKLSGKLKMILQSIIVPIVLFLTVNFRPQEWAWVDWTCVVLVYLTVIVTVWSGIPYVTGLRAVLLDQQQGDGGPEEPGG
ncbi:MAG: CDP-alcohol phosphatidyltransferase family protein [Planctomycetota bacterium]|jgi:CDP-diacylglycerol--glycerol-3-phosphate 3-phosphatidyltransferase